MTMRPQSKNFGTSSGRPVGVPAGLKGRGFQGIAPSFAEIPVVAEGSHRLFPSHHRHEVKLTDKRRAADGLRPPRSSAAAPSLRCMRRSR